MIRIAPSKREEVRRSCLAIVANTARSRIDNRPITTNEFMLINLHVEKLERIISEATLRKRLWTEIKRSLHF